MKRHYAIGIAIALISAPAHAGPCTDRIAELEKAITAQHEGGGPAIQGNPATSDSTGSAAARQADSRIMQDLNQAKAYDQEGKLEDCTRALQRAEAAARPVTK